MAVRVNALEVTQIMDGCTLSEETVDAFIVAANLLINKVFSGDTTTGEDMLKEIEKWFAAHMIASTLWRVATKEKIGEVSIEYTGAFGENLASTPYGQMVKQLDTTGKMNNIGKKAASIYAITSFD